MNMVYRDSKNDVLASKLLRDLVSDYWTDWNDGFRFSITLYNAIFHLNPK